MKTEKHELPSRYWEPGAEEERTEQEEYEAWVEAGCPNPYDPELPFN